MIALPSIFFPRTKLNKFDFKILRVHCKNGNWIRNRSNQCCMNERQLRNWSDEGGKNNKVLVGFFSFIAEEWILNNNWYSVWKHHGDLNVRSTFLIHRVILLYLVPFNKSSWKSVPVFNTPTCFNEISGRRQMALDAKSIFFIVCFKLMYRLTIICSNTSL